MSQQSDSVDEISAVYCEVGQRAVEEDEGADQAEPVTSIVLDSAQLRALYDEALSTLCMRPSLNFETMYRF